MKWYECESCLSEFRVVSDTSDDVEYCPFCGADIVDEEDYDDEDEEDYE